MVGGLGKGFPRINYLYHLHCKMGVIESLLYAAVVILEGFTSSSALVLGRLACQQRCINAAWSRKCGIILNGLLQWCRRNVWKLYTCVMDTNPIFPLSNNFVRFYNKDH